MNKLCAALITDESAEGHARKPCVSTEKVVDLPMLSDRGPQSILLPPLGSCEPTGPTQVFDRDAREWVIWFRLSSVASAAALRRS
jgi:hypothetical protein